MSMTLEQAIRILHPETESVDWGEAIKDAGYIKENPFSEIEADKEACLLACEVMQREVERRNGCLYCDSRNGDVLHTEKCSGLCDIEVVVTGSVLEVNSYNHETPYTEDISFNLGINFCPMCGKPLNDGKVDGDE